jgi:hypothetical protein
MMETKACRWDHSFNLLDEQMERYKVLQAQGYDIDFCIFHHEFPAIKSYAGTEEELFSLLASGPLAASVLPFSAVLTLHRAPTPFVRRYEAPRRRTRGEYPSCSVVYTKTAHELFCEPEDLFSKLGKSYHSEVLMTEPISVQRECVMPFPVRIVT